MEGAFSPLNLCYLSSVVLFWNRQWKETKEVLLTQVYLEWC